MSTRLITKQLAGEEDCLLGRGTAVQARASGDQTLTKVDLIKWVTNATALSLVDVDKFNMAMLGNSLVLYRWYSGLDHDDPNGTTIIDGPVGVDGVWLVASPMYNTVVDQDGNITISSTIMTIDGSIAGTAIKDEDNMVSDSDTHLATQQSIKAYVDTIAAFKGALVTKSSLQSILNATFTALTVDTEDYDTSDIHHASVNTERLTVPAGVTRVRITGGTGFAGNATGRRVLVVQKNGSSSYAGVPSISIEAPSTNIEHMSVATPVITVTAGDYFHLWVYQNSTSALNCGYDTHFAMEVIK